MLREEENINQIINLIFKNLDNILCEFRVRLLGEENVTDDSPDHSRSWPYIF